MIIFNHVFHESWLRMTFMVLLPGLVAVGATAQPAGVQLDTLTVKHIDFQGRTQEGIIICNHIIADDLRAIFEQLYKEKYPIERIRPISEYGDDDERSMRAKNTNYRNTHGEWPLTSIRCTTPVCVGRRTVHCLSNPKRASRMWTGKSCSAIKSAVATCVIGCLPDMVSVGAVTGAR